MTRREIVDISNYQGVPNFALLKQQHPALAGVIIKATEGAWEFTNQDFDAQVAGAQQVGLAIGFYAFWHPGVAASTQAQVFLNRIAGHTPQLGVWVDAEVTDGVSAWSLLSLLREDLGYIAAKYAMRTGIYSAGWFLNPNFIGMAAAQMQTWPLWVAGYEPSLPQLPVPWNQALLWQYTDSYTGPHAMDASVFLGTDEQWVWLTTGRLPGIMTSKDKVHDFQAALHAVSDGVFGPDTDRRAVGVRAMRNAAGRANHAAVKYCQEIMAFGPAAADGIWGPITGSHWTQTVKLLQAALGCPVTGVWDINTDFSFLVLDPLR